MLYFDPSLETAPNRTFYTARHYQQVMKIILTKAYLTADDLDNTYDYL